MIQKAIQQLLDGKDLGRERAREVMDVIMRGEATPAQIGGFLVALRAKGETVDEITGCAEAMREHALVVRARRLDLVDRLAAVPHELDVREVVHASAAGNEEPRIGEER